MQRGAWFCQSSVVAGHALNARAVAASSVDAKRRLGLSAEQSVFFVTPRTAPSWPKRDGIPQYIG
jgi:hypothetical protein